MVEAAAVAATVIHHEEKFENCMVVIGVILVEAAVRFVLINTAAVLVVVAVGLRTEQRQNDNNDGDRVAVTLLSIDGFELVILN